MAEPGHDNAAGTRGRRHLRASHADRELVIGVLKAAFVAGRLTKAEFDLRVSQTLASRTYGDLGAITADLPPGLAGAQPPRAPVRAQAPQPVNKPLMWGAWAIVVAALAALVLAVPVQSFILLPAGVLGILIAAPIAGTLALDSRRNKRSGGQLPPRPEQHGVALAGDPDAGTGDDLILAEARGDSRVHRVLPSRGGQRAWWSPKARRQPGVAANRPATA